MKVDSTTWCSESNTAGRYLADTLSEICDESLTQKVSVYFHRFNERMHALNSLDKKMRHFYLLLLLEKTQREINKNIRHTKVQTLMQNVLTYLYRKELEKI